ncbi:MAG TPA: YigZ family protein [Bordetella sp.]|uniref:IMPACT family protein n=1 Tax=Bordetella sp. TaxID=28081 RepID=UPI002ED08802
MTHTLAAFCTHEEDIKKSRFLAYAGPVASVVEAMALFARHGDPAATHNCWAYRIGNAYRFNDNGEPGGTAGQPILRAIDGQGFDRVAVLVVRWYGGIKLGAGGLVRAYGGCAANCLRLGERVELIDTAVAHCRCDFAELAMLRARLAGMGVAVRDEHFDEQGAALALEVPRTQLAELEHIVANITRGRGQWAIEAG